MNILNNTQITDLKLGGKILKFALDQVTKAVKPGVSAYDLDSIAEKSLLSKGARPSFKGYYVPGSGKYPSSLCVSVNDEIVHGLPTKQKILNEGDIVSLDIGAEFHGVCTDMAITLPVGKIDPKASRLIEATKKSLNLGIEQAQRGKRIGDIGHAVQSYLEANGYSVIRDLVGHGIGEKPHMEPQIPNYGRAGTGPEILNGMALAIEPMASLGEYDIDIDPDGWTVRTYDQSIVAHFEHTIVIEDGKTIVVTR